MNEWKKEVFPALESKRDEFLLLGYSGATMDEIWECLLARFEKNNELGEMKLHQLVNEIMRLSVNEYMNWLTIHAYKGTKTFESKV
ncbi:post-transcriptional regulator [Bacillus sp. RAR_GA_16]|uniref:post-transcriptional regulator n=1 Tax=Bacillus sp. RAR_GA_16 TaxID=2876774 RepID=UPI001CCC072E|nr:post-transcriptional regulator [Bacillus sp. RAR_GA_16]MCA0171732.1 post-transcriptional regulator [Bacillus sp. RAR_GA_16]